MTFDSKTVKIPVKDSFDNIFFVLLRCSLTPRDCQSDHLF